MVGSFASSIRLTSFLLAVLGALSASSSTALAEGLKVVLRRASGDVETAQLSALDSEKVEATIAGKLTTIPIADLLAVELSGARIAVAPQAWLELLDGSTLLATDFTTTSGTAQFKLLSGQEYSIPTRSLRAVRFRPGTEATNKAWADIVGGDLTGDLLVIRKTAEASEDAPAEGGIVLDQLDGAILGVAATTVKFDFDGDKIDVKREKLEGIAFYQPVARNLTRPLCQLLDRGGGRWMVKSMKLEGENLAVETPVGARINLPLADLATIDLAAGNLLFLTDLEPEKRDALFGLQPAGMTATFAQLYQNRASDTPFKLDGSTHARALALHGKSTLTYRLPEGFKSLRAVVGIDDAVQASSRVQLTIVVDNRELFKGEFDNDHRGPVNLDLDVTGARRLVILLEPLGPDLRAQLLLCQPRLSR